MRPRTVLVLLALATLAVGGIAWRFSDAVGNAVLGPRCRGGPAVPLDATMLEDALHKQGFETGLVHRGALCGGAGTPVVTVIEFGLEGDNQTLSVCLLHRRPITRPEYGVIPGGDTGSQLAANAECRYVYGQPGDSKLRQALTDALEGSARNP